MKKLIDQAIAERQSEYDIDPIFIGRWSPRAMTAEPIPDEELLSVFEAARWAPSSYNNQPWRFIVARRDTPEWSVVFGLLGEFNQQWAKSAALLVVIISHNNFEYNGKPSRTHSFDAGAAWMGLALAGAGKNLVVHGMEGFDYDRAKKELQVPDDYTVEAMAAIGRLADPAALSEELREREKPSERKKLSALLFNGKFGVPYIN